MNHVNCIGGLVTEFGCGCNKGRAAATSPSSVRRSTVYQVQLNGATVAEFASLSDARTKAVEVGGRVKVTSKVE